MFFANFPASSIVDGIFGGLTGIELLRLDTTFTGVVFVNPDKYSRIMLSLIVGLL